MAWGTFGSQNFEFSKLVELEFQHSEAPKMSQNSDGKHSVQSGRLVMMGWEDMADMDQNASRNRLCLSTGTKPSGECFRVPVLKDRPNFGRKAF